MRTGRRSSDMTDIYEWLRRRSPSPNKLLALPGTVSQMEYEAEKTTLSTLKT